MQKTDAIDTAVIHQWVEAGQTIQQIEFDLRSKGVDEALIAETIKEFKKQFHAKRQFKGFIYAGIGAFLGFLSCVLSLINPWPELFNLILFGLTTVAICAIMLGLYFVFEN